jgi:hypothetical protein
MFDKIMAANIRNQILIVILKFPDGKSVDEK